MSETPENNAPDLQIDSDWKAEAQAEKDRLAAEEKAKAEQGGDAAGAAGAAGGPGKIPPADFRTLVSEIVTQAMFAMGMIPDPNTGQRVAIIDLAKYQIDMLGVLQTKTEGNLDEEEKKLLEQALYELRMHFVALSQEAMKQAASESGADGNATESPEAGGGIVTP